MSNKTVMSPLQVCYDCWNFVKTSMGTYACKFGQYPASGTMPPEKEGEEPKLVYRCWSYLDVAGKEAPALTELMSDIAKLRAENKNAATAAAPEGDKK